LCSKEVIVAATSERIRRLERDLQEIKNTLDRNKSLLRELLSRTFRFLPLVSLSGIACAVISLSYYIALRVYGSLGDVPAAFHWILGTLIVASAAITSGMKLAMFFRHAKEMDAERPYSGLLLRILKSSTVLHLFIPVMALIVIFSILLSSAGQAPYCVAVWAIGLGILWNALGVGFALSEYIAFGYWMLVTGVLSLFIGGIHPLIWIAIIFGFGFTAFAVIVWLKADRE
jgi:hypothetical protein